MRQGGQFFDSLDTLGRIALDASLFDGTIIKTSVDRKATNISVLAAISVRRDGQNILLFIKNMGGEIAAAWGEFLADMDAR